MTELSIALKSAGFVHCHHRVEQAGGTDTLIESGTPFTFDFNNGISAIYDEKGHPWTLPNRLFTDAMAIALFRSRYHSRWEYGGTELRRGAYVPHSNDGGAWAKSFKK